VRTHPHAEAATYEVIPLAPGRFGVKVPFQTVIQRRSAALPRRLRPLAGLSRREPAYSLNPNREGFIAGPSAPPSARGEVAQSALLSLSPRALRRPADPKLPDRGMPQRRCRIPVGVNAYAAHGVSRLALGTVGQRFGATGAVYYRPYGYPGYYPPPYGPYPYPY